MNRLRRIGGEELDQRCEKIWVLVGPVAVGDRGEGVRLGYDEQVEIGLKKND